MRLFTTKQSCDCHVKVAGHISDDEAQELSKAYGDYYKNEEKACAYDDLKAALEEDLLKPMNDCDSFYGTPKDLWESFHEEFQYNLDPRKSDSLFRYYRAIQAMEYLEDTGLVNCVKVQVQKYMYCTGIVEVLADSDDEGMQLVESMIAKGEIQTTSVEWNEPTYEDFSFETTGDVD